MNPLVTEARDLSAKATKGPWQVIPSTDQPFAPDECRIATTWKQGQLNDFAPVVNAGKRANGACVVVLEGNDAALIARYRTLCLELADLVEQREYEIETRKMAERSMLKQLMERVPNE